MQVFKLNFFVLYLVEVAPVRFERGREPFFLCIAMLVSAVLPVSSLYPTFLFLPLQLRLQGCFRQGLYNSFTLLHATHITSNSFLYLT